MLSRLVHMRPLALITGASRGIGAATAQALADTHDLLLGGRDAHALARLAVTLPNAKPWPLDLTSIDPAAVAGIDRLDVLVHSAGVADLGPLAETTVETWHREFAVNVIAVAELTRLLLPALRAARGRVVVLNSGQGRNPSPGWGAYAASKFAVRAYADVLRAEESANGLRVTTVYPGRTATDMQREVRAAEGAPYQPENYLDPNSVAHAIHYAIHAPADAHLPELVIRPAG
jgi:NADP-dependent 3-hydroxy acid dehydrogenase YdfG